jgi:hypothetical protein
VAGAAPCTTPRKYMYHRAWLQHHANVLITSSVRTEKPFSKLISERGVT